MLSTAPLIASLRGLLEFRGYVPVGEEEREGEGKEMVCCIPEGQLKCWALCLEAFLSFLQARILGEVSGESFSRIFISSPAVPFQVHGLH